ncbi:MAG: glycosyltransferase [Pseudomonadota bacterium]
MAAVRKKIRRGAIATTLPSLPNDFGPIIDNAIQFFDETWYLAQYPEVSESELSPVDHYRQIGAFENLSPNPVFDAEFYVRTYPDVVEANLPAIVHYMMHGGREWRRPCPYFDMDRYFEAHQASVEATPSGTIVEDFFQSSDRARTFRFLDVSFYRPFNATAQTPNALLVDFLTHGLPAGRHPHLLLELQTLELTGTAFEKRIAFSQLWEPDSPLQKVKTHPLTDPEFYMRKHGGLSEHPIIHYLNHWRTGDRWIHPLFDCGFYMKQDGADVATVDPLTHYITLGEEAGLWPNAYFDPAFYRRMYADKLESGIHPLVHYMDFGHMVWFQPSENFGQRYYLARYPEVAERNEPALLEFLHVGRAAGRQAMPPKPFFDRTAGLTPIETVQMIKAAAKPQAEPPLVSVIVPAYKNVEYTLRCVLSMLESGDKTPFEIVIADDQSPDDSGKFLARELADVPGVVAYENETNLGFLKSCNAAVQRTSTKYLILLNNDTAVLPGWLDEMVATFDRDPYIGMVGSKLIYPNGLLQEAGGIVWDEGVCANYGRIDDPGRPEFNYERDADYISGASIMVRRDLWDHAGGFSEYLAPAYYEDTDFAMKVRSAGMRVVYQPLSVVVHYEGISSGTDTSTGVKSYQVINQKKFAEHWRADLAKLGKPGSMTRDMVDRRPKGSVLIYDADSPKPDKDSGSITAFFYMKLLTELGYRVTFVPENLQWSGRYSRDLQRIGVEVIHRPYARDPEQYVLENADRFDLFILSRVTAGGSFFPRLKAACPDKPIVFDTVDIHHLRMLREAELSGDQAALNKAYETKQLELDIIQKADATIIVSEHEVDYLRDEIGPFPSVVIPLIYEPFERDKGFQVRQDIAFVGGYRHPPNIDAVQHLVEDIWPRFREHNLGANLHIIGSHMPADFQDYADDDISIVGFVEDLETYLSRIRFTVAPLRYGAGVKGKVGNSLRMGVPVIGTRMATEGMGLVAGEHVLVGEDTGSFAALMADLYCNEQLWNNLSVNGQAYVESAFGKNAARSKLEGLARGLIKPVTKDVTP